MRLFLASSNYLYIRVVIIMVEVTTITNRVIPMI